MGADEHARGLESNRSIARRLDVQGSRGVGVKAARLDVDPFVSTQIHVLATNFKVLIDGRTDLQAIIDRRKGKNALLTLFVMMWLVETLWIRSSITLIIGCWALNIVFSFRLLTI